MNLVKLIGVLFLFSEINIEILKPSSACALVRYFCLIDSSKIKV